MVSAGILQTPMGLWLICRRQIVPYLWPMGHAAGVCMILTESCVTSQNPYTGAVATVDRPAAVT